MGELKISIEEMLCLMEKMAETKLGKFELDTGDFRLSIGAKKEQYAVSVPDSHQGTGMVQMVAGEDGPAAVYPAAKTPEPEVLRSGNVVEAPIVGTFYTAPAPDKDPFVQVGKQVKKGDVLFIIESMKLMNEIQSEHDGVVSEILLENASAVEYGQPVMIIE